MKESYPIYNCKSTMHSARRERVAGTLWLQLEYTVRMNGAGTKRANCLCAHKTAILPAVKPTRSNEVLLVGAQRRSGWEEASAIDSDEEEGSQSAKDARERVLFDFPRGDDVRLIGEEDHGPGPFVRAEEAPGSAMHLHSGHQQQKQRAGYRCDHAGDLLSGRG